MTVDANISKPEIRIAQSEYERLVGLANAVSDREPELSDFLLSELERAEVVPDTQLGDDTIRMGAGVRYVTETGAVRDVVLVYPGEADISAGKISILTPIGAALIGLSSGQSIDWQARDGRNHRLTVKSVHFSGVDSQVR
ncbi:nucleoside diphosphate kinase regulator [Oricola thermophila]|uniref:Nucleoside diphosphate kinase regulator n=1 Tax=Oricola thermophila TaxID=2742145 RepID=A0A6N1VI97_9HYPH|nr:nucleoside diphosphate kinase regulator [Oricola thermophila]